MPIMQSYEYRMARVLELVKARLDCYGIANPIDDELFAILIMLGRYDSYLDWELPSYLTYKDDE